MRLDDNAGDPLRSTTVAPAVRGELPSGRFYTPRFRPMLVIGAPKEPAVWSLDHDNRAYLDLTVNVDGRELGFSFVRRDRVRIPERPLHVDTDLRSQLRGSKRLGGPLERTVASLADVETSRVPALRVFGTRVRPTLARWHPTSGTDDSCSDARPCPLVWLVDPTGRFNELTAGYWDLFIDLPEHNIVIDVYSKVGEFAPTDPEIQRILDACGLER